MNRDEMAQLPQHLVFEVCERMIGEEGPAAVAKWLKEQGWECSRQEVYAIMKEGIKRRMLFLCPPTEINLAKSLNCYVTPPLRQIRVVNVRDLKAFWYVAQETAQVVLELIQTVASRKERIQSDDTEVHLGLGAGRFVREVAQNLAALLRTVPRHELPFIVLHALSTGFLPANVATSPNHFFVYFEELGDRIHHIGFLYQSVAEENELQKAKNSPLSRDAFAQRDKIDIVVTSLGTSDDSHTIFSRLIKEMPVENHRALSKKQWVGEVLRQPYADDGKIKLPHTPVCLFTFDELVEFAKKDGKHVVMLAGPCPEPGCGARKHRALLPLLKNADMRVLNTLVIDVTTAEELLAGLV